MDRNCHKYVATIRFFRMPPPQWFQWTYKN